MRIGDRITAVGLLRFQLLRQERMVFDDAVVYERDAALTMTPSLSCV